MPCAEQRVRFPRRGGSQKPPHPSEPCVLPCAKGSNPPGKPSRNHLGGFLLLQFPATRVKMKMDFRRAAAATRSYAKQSKVISAKQRKGSIFLAERRPLHAKIQACHAQNELPSSRGSAACKSSHPQTDNSSCRAQKGVILPESR